MQPRSSRDAAFHDNGREVWPLRVEVVAPMPSLGRTPSICRDGEEIRFGLDEFLRGAEPTKAGER